jgi:hypothetical protein
MNKKRKKILKSMKKRIEKPKYGYFHIRKSLVVALLSSCAILLGSTISSSYADDSLNLKNNILKNHFQERTNIVDTSKSMNDVLEIIESVQLLEDKYVEILDEKLTESLGKLTKGDIANKLGIVSTKLKNFSYDEIINNADKKEKFAQLSALKYVLQSMYDHNHYSKNVDIDELLKK